MEECLLELSKVIARYDFFLKGVLAKKAALPAAIPARLLPIMLAQTDQVERDLREAGLGLGAVSIVEEGIVWAPEILSDLCGILPHALNNAIDHGFVLPQQRGKVLTKRPKLELSCRKIGDEGLIEVVDNGVGIDFERVRDAMLSANPNAATLDETDLCEALFISKMSTADQVTQRSGRGLGLGAIREQVATCGGSVWIENIAPHGVKLSIRVPLSKKAA